MTKDEALVKMHRALTKIAKEYMSPKQIRKESRGAWGLGYEEALEMSYENIQLEAKTGIKGINLSKLKP